MLVVTPEVMRAKAVSTHGKIQGMKNSFENLETMVNRTGNYWIGEAGDTHREYFLSKKTDIDLIFRRLSEHARELEQMALVYENAEKEAAQISEDLPADVII